MKASSMGWSKSLAGGAAALGTALLAHIPCCWGPQIALLLAGSSASAGWFANLAAWRPYLLALAVVQLGVGFYLAYRRTPQHCEPGECHQCHTHADKQRRVRIGVAWVVAGLIGATLMIPPQSHDHDHEAPGVHAH